MNTLDVLLIVVLIMATLRGVLVGALGQVLPLAGFALGLVVGAWAAPLAEGLVDEGSGRVVASLMVVFGGAIVGGSAGQLVAWHTGVAIRRRGLGPVDEAAGAFTGLGGALLAAWLLTAMLANVPAAPVAAAIQSSEVLRAIDRIMPPAPPFLARIQGLLETTGLPPVFAGLEPDPTPAGPMHGNERIAAAAARAQAATFKVTARGCGAIHSGSGFLVDARHVVTNAHVIAGATGITVHARRALPATAVYVDAEMDIAVLRVASTGGRPLPIDAAPAPRGAPAAVVGFPGGGAERVSPAVVAASYTAVGRDIYSRSLVRRPVYELRADVEPGNSGGPVVDTDGEAIGLVFSKSALHDDVGYAIRASALTAPIRSATSARTPATTGPCPP